jgi:hypothetical protein
MDKNHGLKKTLEAARKSINNAKQLLAAVATSHSQIVGTIEVVPACDTTEVAPLYPSAIFQLAICTRLQQPAPPRDIALYNINEVGIVNKQQRTNVTLMCTAMRASTNQRTCWCAWQAGCAASRQVVGRLQRHLTIGSHSRNTNTITGILRAL